MIQLLKKIINDDCVGWFCFTALAISAIVLILMVCSILTPFFNSIIWGIG